jgi:hypothetical protein
MYGLEARTLHGVEFFRSLAGDVAYPQVDFIRPVLSRCFILSLGFESLDSKRMGPRGQFDNGIHRPEKHGPPEPPPSPSAVQSQYEQYRERIFISNVALGTVRKRALSEGKNHSAAWVL